MKYIIILADGVSDEPVAMLGGRTPLQAAHKPNIDRVAALGNSGLLKTVPPGFAPGSEIAHLSLLGYDVPSVFEGRGSLEAASMGIDIWDGEMAMRCNLITVENGLIKNHSAGHISSEEAAELIKFLQEKLGGCSRACMCGNGLGNGNSGGEFEVNFYPGVSYRHLLKIKGGNKNIITVGPHDVPGKPYGDYLVKAAVPSAEPTAALLNSLIEESQKILPEHPVNISRIARGKDPANSIWPWSPGYRPKMQTLMEKYGFGSGAVISAVDLIKGIGVYAGLKPVEVEGVTGLYDTNYEGKAEAALEALKKNDFVFLHIEASDEAGHEGDAALKVKTVEYLDRRVVGPILEEISQWDEPVVVAILPDHPTPVEKRIHTSNPVPFVIYRTNSATSDSVQKYDEDSAAKGNYGLLAGDEFMNELFNGKK